MRTLVASTIVAQILPNRRGGAWGKVLSSTLAPHRGRRALPCRPVQDRWRRHPFDTRGATRIWSEISAPRPLKCQHLGMPRRSHSTKPESPVNKAGARNNFRAPVSYRLMRAGMRDLLSLVLLTTQPECKSDQSSACASNPCNRYGCGAVAGVRSATHLRSTASD